MNSDELVAAGNLMAEAGNHRDAIRTFEEAAQSGAVGLELNIGNSLVALGDYGSAMEFFQRGWLNGDNDAGFNLASLLESRGASTAAGIYESLVADGYAKASINLALLLDHAGQRDKAIEVLGQVLSDPEVGSTAEAILGSLYLSVGDESRAEPLLRATANEDAFARADLGHLLARTGRTEEAIRVWHEGAAHDEPSSMVPLANLLSERGERQKSGDLYRRAFELGDAFAATNLAIDLWDDGNRAEAILWAHRAADAGDEAASRWLESIDAQSHHRD